MAKTILRKKREEAITPLQKEEKPVFSKLAKEVKGYKPLTPSEAIKSLNKLFGASCSRKKLVAF